MVSNQLLQDEALTKREDWEHSAPNAYQQMDLQVLDMIAEIRTLRSFLKRVVAADGVPGMLRPLTKEVCGHLGIELVARGVQEANKPPCGNPLCRVQETPMETLVRHDINCPERGPGWA
jgi:hypothetical protein